MTDATTLDEGALEQETNALALSAGNVARDVAANVAARVFAMVCSSITALLIANALSLGEYGGYAIVVGINVVLVMGLDLGLTSSLARYAAQGRASTGLVVRVALARLGLIGAAALAVIASPVLDSGDEWKLAPLLPALAVLVIAQSTIAFHFGSLPSLRRIRLLVLVTLLQPALELAFVLHVRSRDGGAEDMLYATAASAAAVSLFAWILLLAPGRAAAASVPQLPSDADHATFGLVAHYGRRIFLVSLMIAAIGQVDQFVIGLFHPLREVAPYALAIKLQALLAAAAIAVAGIVAPRIATSGGNALALYRQWLAIVGSCAFGAVVVLGVLATEAFGAIGVQFRDESALLVAMLPFLWMSAVAPLPSISLNQTGHAGRRLHVALSTLLVNAVLDLALVPWLGAMGAVIATTVAFGWYFLRHHVLLQGALRPDALRPPARLDTLAIRVALVALVAGLVAAGVRWLLREYADDPADLVVLIVAGGVAGALHVAWSLRLVARFAR